MSTTDEQTVQTATEWLSEIFAVYNADEETKATRALQLLETLQDAIYAQAEADGYYDELPQYVPQQ